MKIGVIADDFTGASDVALTLAEAGMTVAQFIGVPEAPAAPDLQAGVVALKSRTAPVEDAVAQSRAACAWLRAQGAEQIILKVCSTFDSTASGNIGPVLDALAEAVSAGAVMVCPAFPESGRSVYEGHLFVADRLLSESGMQNHPLTPMTDADLRRVLTRQSRRAVGHIPVATVQNGGEAIVQALDAPAHFIVDAISNNDLKAIGLAAKDMPLVCGGSGIALGLPANFGCAPSQPVWTAVRGKGAVLSGSCSRATRDQVAAYRAIAPTLRIDAEAVMDEALDLDRIADWAVSCAMPPLIYSSTDPVVVAAAQARFGRAVAADAIEAVFAQLAQRLVARGIRRIVVAGGETSGVVVTGLEAQVLHIGPRAAAGVPLVMSGGVALALKSGNFGGPQFFRDALAMMEAGA